MILDNTTFLVTSGRFTAKRSTVDQHLSTNLRPGENYLLGHYDQNIFYVEGLPNNPIAVFRPTNPCTLDKTQIAADGLEEATISGLPLPCTVSVSGPINGTIDLEEVDLDSLPLTFDVPGTYTVKIAAWPHLDKEFTIEAT